jgi:hypothetical protein
MKNIYSLALLTLVASGCGAQVAGENSGEAHADTKSSIVGTWVFLDPVTGEKQTLQFTDKTMKTTVEAKGGPAHVGREGEYHFEKNELVQPNALLSGFKNVLPVELEGDRLVYPAFEPKGDIKDGFKGEWTATVKSRDPNNEDTITKTLRFKFNDDAKHSGLGPSNGFDLSTEKFTWTLLENGHIAADFVDKRHFVLDRVVLSGPPTRTVLGTVFTRTPAGSP